MLDLDLFGEPAIEQHKARLSREFEYPPFSVVSARDGWWQERKRQWLALGIKSEVGRGADLIENGGGMASKARYDHASPGGSAMPSTNYSKDGARGDGGGRAIPGTQKLAPGGGGTGAWIGGKDRPTGAAAALKEDRPLTRTESGLVFGAIPNYDEANREAANGTSIFDPVLTELAYRWFCPRGGLICDPFAGGSVRGIVASVLGYEYAGFELRPEQVAANRAQAATICPSAPPIWHCGDSGALLPEWPEQADFLFSCPPYGDLEVYSDLAPDLSAMPHEDFRIAYSAIIGAAANRLKPNRFAAFVVGDFRCKKGFYRNFPGDTVAAFEAAGLRYYNECILVTAVGSLPVRVGKQFRSGRKLGKTHQQMLIFVKGDPREAAAACNG